MQKQGGAFLDLAVHEDEALRLWRDLGLIEHSKVGGWLKRPSTVQEGDGMEGTSGGLMGGRLSLIHI